MWMKIKVKFIGRDPHQGYINLKSKKWIDHYSQYWLQSFLSNIDLSVIYKIDDTFEIQEWDILQHNYGVLARVNAK